MRERVRAGYPAGRRSIDPDFRRSRAADACRLLGAVRRLVAAAGPAAADLLDRLESTCRRLRILLTAGPAAGPSAMAMRSSRSRNAARWDLAQERACRQRPGTIAIRNSSTCRQRGRQPRLIALPEQFEIPSLNSGPAPCYEPSGHANILPGMSATAVELKRFTRLWGARRRTYRSLPMLVTANKALSTGRHHLARLSRRHV